MSCIIRPISSRVLLKIAQRSSDTTPATLPVHRMMDEQRDSRMAELHTFLS